MLWHISENILGGWLIRENIVKSALAYLSKHFGTDLGIAAIIFREVL
jgi:hypothetical protein